LNKFAFQYENECFALGCILNDPSLLEETTLSPYHFLDTHNKELYKTLLAMKANREDINIISLAQLGESESMKFGGIDHISSITQSVPSYTIFEQYQRNVIDFHTIQKAQGIVQNFMESSKERHHMRDLQQLLNDITVMEIETVRKKESFKEMLAERMNYHYNTPKTGLSGANTGFLNINIFTDGWQPSDLIILGARPSMGKTALVLNSLLNGCKKDNVFGTFFSIEMAKGQVVDRLIAMEAGINLMKMRNPNKTFADDEWTHYTHAVGKLEKLSLDVRDEYTVPTIRAAIKKNLKEHPDKKHVAAIDFLTLIKPLHPSGNVHVDVTNIIQDLKQVAKDMNIPIIVLAQLNRDVEKRQDKRPGMSDIRESGSIEQIADLIAFLYRDDYYNAEAENKGLTELIIAKNRNGSLGTVKLNFQKQTNIFRDVVLG
jgi:replicative DNA helicase